MADIAPFRGIRFDSGIGDLASLTSPPYDVISPAERDDLERKHPNNVVRLILGRDEPGDDDTQNKYTRAADALAAWLRDGILRADPADALYVYEEAYTLDGRDRVQRGLLASVSLDEGSVLPHERTMAAPVDDRLRLMRATAANLEPILCVYSGEGGPGRSIVDDATAAEPLTQFATPDRVGHRLWAIRDEAAVAVVKRELAGVRLVIADGHHRYATAQRYRDERRAREGSGPWDRMMMMLLDAAWAGPSLLAIHRTVSGVDTPRALSALSGPFDVEEASTRDAHALEAELARRREAARTYVMLDRDRAWWLTLSDKEAAAEAMPQDRAPAWRDLDVAVLHVLVFDRLLGAEPGYVHSSSEAEEALSSGNASLCFFLAPTPFDAVRRVAEAREAMPPKSTFFFPKPRSGVVIRLLR